MKAIEFFAGAGGAALGLEAAGYHHLALCEWDPDACATLRAAGLGPVVEGDVRDLDAIEAVAGPSCDLLWSSFPCQAFSTAGKRKGAADARNGWPWSVDAIDRFKPAWFLGENVRGLLMHRGDCTARGGQLGIFGTAPPEDCPGCYFERRILPDLRERFAFVGWWLLDAADYGVPQHRRRVILWAGPAPVVEPVPTHGPGRALPWVSMGEALGIGAEMCAIRLPPPSAKAGNVPRPTSSPAPTVAGSGLAVQPMEGPTIVSAVPPHYRPALLVGSGMKGPAYPFAPSISVSAVGAEVCVIGDTPHGRVRTIKPPAPSLLVGSGMKGSEWGIGRPAPTLRDGNGTAGLYLRQPGLSVVAAGETGAGRPRPMNQAAPTIGTKGTAYLLSPSPTVSAVGECKGSGAGGHPEKLQRASDAPWLATGRRRLTVEECAILQDFPADHPWQGNSQARYRQVGNAVPPTLARVVGEAVMRAAGTV